MRDGSEMKRFIFWLIEYLSAQRPATTIACSEGEYLEAMKLSKNSTYVNNGIDICELESFVREIHEIRKPVRVCTSGRILYQKNPRLFNEIARLLPEVNFIWIGEGELKTELTSPNFDLSVRIYTSLHCFIAVLFTIASLVSGVVKPSLLVIPLVPKNPFVK